MNLGLLKTVIQNLPDDAEVEVEQTSNRFADLGIVVNGDLIKLTDIKFIPLGETE